MKEIKDAIRKWEDSKKQWEEEKNFGAAKKAGWLIDGLELALYIIEEKNNNKLIGDVVDWANKADPEDIERWETFMDKYLDSMGWEPEARKQFIAMDNDGLCLNFFVLIQKVEDFYNDVRCCADRMTIERLLRCHIQYRTII